MKEVIYESANAGDSSGRCSLCTGVVHDIGQTKSAEAERIRGLSLGLQPVSAWHPPARFEFRDSSRSTGGGRHRRASACTLARVTAPDSGWSAARAYECRN